MATINFTGGDVLTTSNPANVTVSGNSFTITKPAWSIKNGSNNNKTYFRFSINNFSHIKILNANERVLSYYPAQTTATVSKGASASIPSNTSEPIDTSILFNASNNTVRTVTVHMGINQIYCYDTIVKIWYTVEPSDYDSSQNIASCKVTLNAPPTFTSTQVSFDTPYVYAGYTTASVTVSDLSAKYGGTISSAVLKIGNQTASRTTNGTLSIALNAGGTFTPTVTVTDSRGQTTTQTLDPITVKTYTAPTVSFTSIRTTSAGVENDEGESAVVTATFGWTSDIESLSAPTVAVTNLDGTAVSTTTTWYKDRALTTAISDWSALTASDMPIYGLIDNSTHNAFNTQYSYRIAITPTGTEGTGTTMIQTLGSAFYTVDFLAGGHGIAFGQPASEEGFFCNMDANFMQDVFLALDTTATSGTDFEIYDALVSLGWTDVIE